MFKAHLVYAVGVGNEVDEEQLQLIAGRLHRVIRSGSFADLDQKLGMELGFDLCIEAGLQNRKGKISFFYG